MNSIEFLLGSKESFKNMLRETLQILVKEYGFVETSNPNLVIPEWMDRGIAYTNEEFVIVFCDDLLEKRFTAIFYRIQKDLNIPFDTENYFTLVAFLHGKGDSVGANKVSDYTSFLDLNDCIRKTSYYVGEYISELLAT